MSIESDNIIARHINIEAATEIFNDYQCMDTTEEILTDSLDCLEDFEADLIDWDDAKDMVSVVMHQLHAEINSI